MKKALIIGAAVLAVGGSTAVYAQHRMAHSGSFFRDGGRMSAEDRSAFLDARIAAVHAGLKLTAEQEKNWPAVEAAVRDFAKLRADRADVRRAARANRDTASPRPDPVERLRQRADSMTENGAALKKIVDAADPLYKSLDDGQKQRLMRLTFAGRREMRHARRDGWQGRGRWMDDRHERGPRGDGPDRTAPRRGPDERGSGRL